MDRPSDEVFSDGCERQIGDEAVWRKRTLWLVAALFGFRLLYSALVPLDLVHDEAYYWDWSRQLDWGYYSKPPMVAWLIGLSTTLGESTTWFVRLPAVVLGTGGLLVIYLLAARMFGAKAGFWAAVLSAATPGNAAMGLLMTIDAPFLFFWCATLYTTWGWLNARRHRPVWLIAAIITAGLGLLSKQTMIGFIPLLGFFLLTGRDDRRELLRPAYWLWAGGAVLFLAPVVWWNMKHDWITLEHTQSHFSGEPAGVWKHVARSLEFVGSQFGVVSPVTCTLYVAVGIAALMAFRTIGRRERFLLIFGFLPMVPVVGLSLLQRVEPNWPASFYPAGIVLVAGWVIGRTNLSTWWQADEKYARRAAIVGAVCALLTYLVPFGFGLQGTRWDAAVRLRGWSELGARVEQHLETVPQADDAMIFVIRDRAMAAELAFYMPRQPRVYMYSGSPHPVSQYDIWGGPAHARGATAVIVTKPGQELPPSIAAAFAQLEPAGEVRVAISAARQHHLQLFRGTGFRAWPNDLRIASPPAHSSTR